MGRGGFGVDINFLLFDFADINNFIKNLGFNSINNDGVVYAGGRGYGSIGNGWYIGGMGAGFSAEQNTTVNDTPRHLSIVSGYGGALLVKRFEVRPFLTFESTMMLGAGATSIEVADVRENPTFDDPEANFIDIDQFKFERAYMVFRPEVSLILYLNHWLGVRGSASYLSTYGGNWESVPFGNVVEGDSPNVPGGMNFTLGAWFGH